MKKNAETFYEDFALVTAMDNEQASPYFSDFGGGMFADGFRGQLEPQTQPPADVEVVVECTLKEMYCGSLKLITFDRYEIHHLPKYAQLFTRSKQIEVKPGFSEKTVLVFKGEGNAEYDQKTSDLVVKFKQIQHPSIKRAGDDLIMIVKCSLEDALRQIPITFKTLDERCLTVSCDQEVSPQACLMIANEGMPVDAHSVKRDQRGNLYIRFDISFPVFDSECVQTLIETLRQN